MRPLEPLLHELRRLDLDAWLAEPVARRFPHFVKLLGGRRGPLPDGDPSLGEVLAAEWTPDQVARVDVASILEEVSRAARRAAAIRDAQLPGLGSPEWPAWLAERRLTWFGRQHPARYVSDYAGQPLDVAATLSENLRPTATRRALLRERLLEKLFPDLLACLAARPSPPEVRQEWAVHVADAAVTTAREIAADVVPAARVVPHPERRMLRIEVPGRDCAGDVARPTVWLDDRGICDRVETCGHPHRCRWTLSALHAAARFLETPEGSSFVRDAVRPEWRRALDALGRAASRGGTVHLTVGSRVTVELRDPAGNPVSPTAAWSAEGLAAIDREVLEANHEHGLVRLLAALQRHPRVRIGERPVRVVGYPLAIHVERREELVVLRLGAGSWSGTAADLATLRRLGHVAFLPSAPSELAYTRLDPVPPDLLPWTGTPFPPDAVPELLAALDRLDVPVVRGPGVVEDVRPWKPSLAVDLAFAPGVGLSGRVRILLWDGTRVVAGRGPERVLVSDDGLREYERDLVAEEVAVEALADELGLTPLWTDEDEPHTFLAPSLQDAVALARRLEARAEPGFAPPLVVSWSRPMRVQTVDHAQVHWSTRVTGAWFTLGGTVDGADLDIQDLLAAIRDRRRYVVVAPDRVVELAAPLFEDLGTIAELADVHRDRLRIGTVHAPLLTLITGEAPALSGMLTPQDVPPTLRADLRPYQRDGLLWLMRRSSPGDGTRAPNPEVEQDRRPAGESQSKASEGGARSAAPKRPTATGNLICPGAVLADDMGLGKTVQAIGLLCASAGPSLVIAPTSVVPNWLAELHRFAPHLRVTDHRGPDRAKDALPETDVLVTSWDLLVRDQDVLAGRRWDVLVLDEAHVLKNPKSRRAHAAARVDARFRLALTGTPVENRLGELWSLLSVVVPGLLPREDVFRARFQLPIERDGDPARLAKLREIVHPFLLRRTKAEVAPFLPPRTERVERVELSPAERTAYDRVRTAAIRALEEKSHRNRMHVLAAITRLRQAACDARLVEPGRTTVGPKVRRLIELATALSDAREQVLVFSEFTSLLDLCEPALAEAGIGTLRLDGSTPPKDRERAVAAFQAGEAPIFLISRKAGGTGLNLTAATTVIHLDPWWNPAVEDQATDRAHRIGQERPVTVVRLLAADTLEEQVLALHARKRALVAGVLEGAGGAEVDVAELMALVAEERAGT